LERAHAISDRLIHVSIGGVICLFVMYITLAVSSWGIKELLYYLNCLGLLVFSEAAGAISLFLFGVSYLPSGFFGGLYVGYRLKENLKIDLAFPGLIGVTVLVVLQFLSGNLNFLNLKFERDILIPLLGNVTGAYFGGYAINWE